jgi:1-deoxy-D-xylulose 5-phosphate reductoisomerase
MQQKKILILGSTGSIGTQTLDIVRCFPEKFCLVGALVLKNTNLLQQQVDEFLLDSVCIIHEEKAKEFSRNNPKRKVYSGQNGALQMIQESDVELVVLSVVGEAGVVLAKEVLQHKKTLPLPQKKLLFQMEERSSRLRKNTILKSFRSIPNIRQFGNAFILEKEGSRKNMAYLFWWTISRSSAMAKRETQKCYYF